MNPLLSDAFVDFLLSDVVDVAELCRLPAFSAHGPETVGPWMAGCRRVAREVLFPSYRAVDRDPPQWVNGEVKLHPKMHEGYAALQELGVVQAMHELPLTVNTLSNAYLMAGNLSPAGLSGLTAGAAHLVEAFGDETVRKLFAEKLRSGVWAGTMALTEPQAGSSLAEVESRVTPVGDGTFHLTGSKIFISGGDQDVTENIVHLVLARLPGAPAGTKGISLFAVPKKHPVTLAANGVQVSGVIHKIGYRGLPSLALSFGQDSVCQAWLVGAPHQGLRCMFQMMNEARLMVGANGAATASVAFHESLAYARERVQGRPLGVSDPTSPPVALVEHPDVRRMLLRQKAIVEGALALLAVTSRYADLSVHHPDEEERQRTKWLLDLLTPLAKSFPAEKGYESNVLALQIHGGYGYSSEYLPEAWLRDQKLNSIHEGTTGIQGLDLLGRKVVAAGGAALQALLAEVEGDVAKSTLEVEGLRKGFAHYAQVTALLGGRGAEGELEAMLGHANDFLEASFALVLGWIWVRVENATKGRSDDFARGVRAAATYWLATEVPKAKGHLDLCASGESSYLTLRHEWLG